MKTNVNMIRKMGEFDVIQRTKDGMFNANSLVEQWNRSNNQNKELKKFLGNAKTIEFVGALVVEENLNGEKSPYLKTRGRSGGTWMHPYLFIKFAMWLNPRFEVKVIKFVYDELIKNRHLAGDNYKKLSSSIAKLKGVDYKEVARAINWIIFNKHESGIRNTASDEQLRDLQELEGQLIFAVDTKLVSNYDQLLATMRTIWEGRHPPCGF